jgi:hypothetical protein
MTIEALHRDIALGNQWRLELDKLLLALVTGLFAFTVAFPPTLRETTSAWLLSVGWAGLAISMVGGLVEMHGWERFYLTYRDYEWHDEDGKPERKRITAWRRLARFCFFAGFVIGAAAIGYFAIENLPSVRVPAK